MMKKVVSGFAVVVAVFSAQASYLSWQVGSSADGYTAGTDYDNANIYAVDGSGEKHLLTSTVLDTSGQRDIAAPMQSEAYADLSALAGGASAYSYFIELSNYNSGSPTFVAQSETVSYRDLSGSITETLPSVGSLASVAVWHGSSYAVPEPTSAVMMMFAAAFLGLKRRKMARSVA